MEVSDVDGAFIGGSGARRLVESGGFNGAVFERVEFFRVVIIEEDVEREEVFDDGERVV